MTEPDTHRDQPGRDPAVESHEPEQTEDRGTAPDRTDLPPEAQRALAEAQARRAAVDARVAQLPTELGGRAGPEPVRYGDWERKGIASDF